MGWHVRRAVLGDADEIARINVASWQSAYRGIISDEFLDAMRPEDRYDRWTSVVTSSTSTTLLAVDDGGLIGAYCVVCPMRDARRAGAGAAVGELAAIYADPEFRGKGAGHAVHEAGVLTLSGDGFRSAVLWVLCANAASRRFYEAHGWTEDHVRQYYRVDRSRVEEMRYSRDLVPSQVPSQILNQVSDQLPAVRRAHQPID